MKKKYSVLLIIICLVTFISSGIISLSNTIVTKKQNYLVEAEDSAPPMLRGEVTTRDLALLASLVYEDVPNDNKYEHPIGLGCIKNDGKTLKSTDCFFSVEGYSKMKRSKFTVPTYIEGLSERKMQSLMSSATATKENGQKYYFLNYSDIEDVSSRGWNIYDYSSIRDGDDNPDNVQWNNFFDAITFRKGNSNNYVIAFRGTDYPDILEWITDIGYAITGGEHVQAKRAYEYAQKTYEKIVNDDPGANIYITGHSLGGYLAQIAGAAIVDYDKGKNSYENSAFQSSNLEDYTKTYGATSNLRLVAYFNGMGVSGVFANNNFTKNIDNALIYLATHKENGEPAKQGDICSTNNYVNYSNNVCSSGRLVLYSMEGDPVSDIGYHFGERYELEAGADALANHINQHDVFMNDLLTGVVDTIDELVSVIKKIFNIDNGVTKNEKTENLSTAIYNLIGVDKINSDIHNVPTFVRNEIGNVNYGLISLIDMLIVNKNYMEDKYGIEKLLDFVNVSHETDSFACIMDNQGTMNSAPTVGDIDIHNMKPNLTMGTGQLKLYSNANSNTAELELNNKEYVVPEKYDFTKDANSFIIPKGTNNFVIFNTGISRLGCAKQYKYDYSLDYGTSWTNITTTTQSSIIIPKNVIDAAANNSDHPNSVYIRVTVNYGNTYTELKINKESSLLNYKPGKTYNTLNGVDTSSDKYSYYSDYKWIRVYKTKK